MTYRFFADDPDVDYDPAPRYGHFCTGPNCGTCDDIAERPERCSECKGTGELFDSEAGGWTECWWCQGSGEEQE